MSKFKIYKASAGSGKTYSLVYEYIKILIQNPTEYKHILAVTFTNDATEEMKSRVLNQLKNLAEDPTSSPYLKKLEEECEVDQLHIQKRAAESLGLILHNYSNFNISTIDTFFQKILRAFAKDIGISAAYNLQLDINTAVQEITEKVISNTNDDHKQAKWLMKAALEKIEDGKNWNIREELRSLFKETFSENYQEKEEKIRASFQDEGSIEVLQNKIKQETESFENTLKNLANKCNELLPRFGLNKLSFAYTSASFYSWIAKIANGIFEAPGPRFLSAIDQVENWYAKTAEESIKDSITLAYNAGLNEYMVALRDHYNLHIDQYNSNNLIKANLSYFVMFESMVDEMMKYKEENDILFISDTNQFINEIIGNNEESFIFEKAGNYFHHYLIDEFQDTSQLQWKNFKPLISNAVSQGHTSLVVGDVKQSIYRFRNGDWRLLHEQAGREITYHEIIPLAENHRSLENIVKFNNSLYQIAPAVTSEIYQNDIGDTTAWDEKFAECYMGQEQLVSKKNKDSGGYVKLNLFTELKDVEDEDASVKAQKLNELVHDLADALQRGYQPGNIAILVFTKKEAYTVANHLRQYVEQNRLQDKINIVTQSSLNISNSHTVRLLLAALQFLANKKDQVSLSHVFAEYQQYFLQSPGLDFLKKDVIQKLEEFKNNAVILKSLPLQLLVDSLVRFFELEKETNEHIFLQHFKDALYEYLKKNPDDLANFLEWWEESFEKFQVEMPQNERSLQIITIHKSKGLEFDLVFIPFAEWGLDSAGLKADLLWLDLDADGTKTLPVKYDKKMLHSTFTDDYLETKFYNYLDKLNLLYVATTRAVRELYIYSSRPISFKLKELKPNIKTIFCSIFEKQQTFDDGLHLNLGEFKNSENNTIIVGEKTNPHIETKISEFESLEINMRSSNIFEALSIKQQSSDLRDGLEVKHEALKQTGIIFHSVISTSRSLKEALSMLRKLFIQRKIDQKLFDRFTNDFTGLFEQPQMLEWERSLTPYSEYSFCRNGEILKPDKFYVGEQEAIVIDFKTGRPMPEYAEQVKGYCNAVEALFKRPTRGYIYYTQTQRMEEIMG